jgi:hypothetical protein
MTKWQEFPLRAQGRPWAGINTRSGKLDDGTGQMTDSSVNCLINEADKLAKRKGLIRGLDERFAGPVCGIHRYTDNCGQEWLLIADQAGVSIRQPFSIPTFGNSDAYPSDEFQAAGDVDPNFWLNAGGYRQSTGLLLKPGVLNGGDLRWFKDATNFSYAIDFDYQLDGESACIGVIKQGTTARLEGRVAQESGVVYARLVWIDGNGTETVLVEENTGNDERGSALLTYVRDVGNSAFSVQFLVFPEEDPEVALQDFTTLTTLDDSEFGQGTSLRLERALGSTSPTILRVQGEPN